MRTTVSYFFATILLAVFPKAGSADFDAPCRIVDTPTAGSPAPWGFILESALFDGGGLVQRALFGISRYAAVGVSYGGSDIIGSKRVSWQPHVGVQARVRLIEESMKSPALSLGFDSQGDGPFLRGEKLNRYRYKSRGVYLVVSRNYRFFGNLGVHCGANWSPETSDGDSDPSFWAGLDKNIGPAIGLCGEYDFASNDNRTGRMSAGRGYLNCAVKWQFGKSFAIEFDLRNILRVEQRDSSGEVVKNPQPSRELRFSYSGAF
jgi:hypothetical protein